MAPLGRQRTEPALLASLKTRESPDDGVSVFTPTRPVVAAIAPPRPTVAAVKPAPLAVAALASAPTIVAAYAPTPAASGVFAESDALAAANRIASNGPARTVSLEASPPSPRDVPPPSPYGALVPSAYGDLPPWPADPAASPSLMAELRR